MAEHKPLTPAELAEMRAYTNAAPPEPWTDKDGDIVAANGERLVETHNGYYPVPPKARTFMVNSRTDMPRLLDEVERFRSVMRDVLARLEELETFAEFNDGRGLSLTAQEMIDGHLMPDCYYRARDLLDGGRQALTSE